MDARKWFKGPKVNIEHLMLGRREAGTDGVAPAIDKSSTLSSSRDSNKADKVGRMA